MYKKTTEKWPQTG